jgi:hypothetical protein
MFDYIHITQGRLRVRIASLKADSVRARELQIALQQIRGVRSVEINLLTGSVLIQHDGRSTTSEVVSARLSEFAQSALASAMTTKGTSHAARNAAGFVVSRLAESAFEQLVKVSVAALL